MLPNNFYTNNKNQNQRPYAEVPPSQLNLPPALYSFVPQVRNTNDNRNSDVHAYDPNVYTQAEHEVEADEHYFSDNEDYYYHSHSDSDDSRTSNSSNNVDYERNASTVTKAKVMEGNGTSNKKRRTSAAPPPARVPATATANSQRSQNGTKRNCRSAPTSRPTSRTGSRTASARTSATRTSSSQRTSYSGSINSYSTQSNPLKAPPKDLYYNAMLPRVQDNFDDKRYIRKEGEFTFGLCTCCKRGQGFCCEAWCCYYCDLTRQYNMAYHSDFDGGHYYRCCLLMILGDLFTTAMLASLFCGGGLVSCSVNYCTHTKTRARFHIDGSQCQDCGAAYFCGWCVVQQTIGEYMAHRLRYPTSWTLHSPQPTPQVEAADMR